METITQEEYMNKSLVEMLEIVEDETSFLKFMKALLKDRQAEVEAEKVTPIDPFGKGALGWENHTIEAFLERGLSWALTTNFGETQGLADKSPWRRVATLLYCGKIYE